MAELLTEMLQRLPETLVLWDVDHTLIENGGVSKETYALAFELLTGQVATVRPVTDGRTDFQIMRELLESNGVNPSEYVDISQFEGVLIDAMSRKAPELPERGYALQGVQDVLVALACAPKVIQSVLTGNIASNARAKLGAFGLDEWVDLEVGGYGSDGKIRSELVDAARQKVTKKYRVVFDSSSTVLVGDTPFDVKAARDGGAKVIAVATGTSSVDELIMAGADVTLDSLASIDRFVNALYGLRMAS